MFKYIFQEFKNTGKPVNSTPDVSNFLFFSVPPSQDPNLMRTHLKIFLLFRFRWILYLGEPYLGEPKLDEPKLGELVLCEPKKLKN